MKNFILKVVGVFVEGAFVDGAFVDGVFVDGAFVDGVVVVGAVVDGVFGHPVGQLQRPYIWGFSLLNKK